MESNGLKLLFSVTKEDFDIQTFSVGGHGGGGKDTSNSGVRLSHRASGAVGEGREARSNTLNRRSAFKKLVDTPKFQAWHKLECARRMGTVEVSTETKNRPDAGFGAKIRTYHFPKHSVKDHRTGKVYPLEPIMDGRLETMIHDLIEHAVNPRTDR